MSTAEPTRVPAYDSRSFYDEMYDEQGRVRLHYEQVHRSFAAMGPSELARRRQAFGSRMLEEGITFTLHAPGAPDPLERTIPSTASRASYLPPNGACSRPGCASGPSR